MQAIITQKKAALDREEQAAIQSKKNNAKLTKAQLLVKMQA